MTALQPRERTANIIKVLDYGYVRLEGVMGSDSSIVRSARVSYANDGDDRTDSENARLISYLYRNGHTSPFESVVFTFEVKAPIFVFRQWHRHRTWSYNEVSARYTELPDEFYLPDVENIQGQHASNKQMRTGDSIHGAVDARNAMRNAGIMAFNTYRALLDAGVARELARAVLPVSTYSRMYATVDLHNLFHFLRLRLHEHAQYEIRVYAQAMLELIEPIVPMAVSAFREKVV